MRLSSLRTFLTIVESGNLKRAAERLHVTQSTVTARLNGLESELGQELFLRRKSGSELTAAGFKFLRYAQLMTDLWRQARQETALPMDVDAVCNLGCHFDLWPGLGRRFFESLRGSSRRLALAAWPGEQRDLDRWLSSGLIDAAFCFSPGLRENWTAFPLGEDRLILVSSTPRALMRWDPRYIYVDSGEEFRRDHAAAYPDGDTPTTTFGSAVWALEHILAHGGSAHLPDRLIAAHLAAGRLHEVPGAPVFKRSAYLVVEQRAAAQWPWLEAEIASLIRETREVLHTRRGAPGPG